MFRVLITAGLAVGCGAASPDAQDVAAPLADAQAARAYSIAEVRFSEGLSTPVELTESRVQLEQARLQRVTTARDLEVARLRIALLKDLPLTLGGIR
jgi:outer membrane protein TolC